MNNRSCMITLLKVSTLDICIISSLNYRRTMRHLSYQRLWDSILFYFFWKNVMLLHSEWQDMLAGQFAKVNVTKKFYNKLWIVILYIVVYNKYISYLCYRDHMLFSYEIIKHFPTVCTICKHIYMQYAILFYRLTNCKILTTDRRCIWSFFLFLIFSRIFNC